MNGRSRKPVVAGLLSVLVAIATSAAIQASIDRRLASYRQGPEVVWLPSGKILRRLSFGHEGLLANIYWTRVVQYYGRQRHARQTDFSLLTPLLNITTDLDPQLLVAYKFGSIFLSQPPPDGAGDPQAAIRLIRKGIQANPDEWRLWHDLGFIYYWDLKDYQSAANAYLEGGKNPRADSWMKMMAAVILRKGGDKETSRFLWTEIYRSAEDEASRQNAKQHMDALKAADEIQQIQRLASEFHQKTGRWPQSISELASQGFLQGIPKDPLGFAYQMQAQGKVDLDPKSKIQIEEGPSPP